MSLTNNYSDPLKTIEGFRDSSGEGKAFKNDGWKYEANEQNQKKYCSLRLFNVYYF